MTERADRQPDCEQGLGASADADRATHERSQSALSAPSVGIPSAVLDAVAFAIERARCPGREGPYGGYDYGHNPAFYGPAPKEGRYVVRDFRDYRSPTWGSWVHQTDDEEAHEQALLRLTGRHIAEAAITAYLASGTEARRAETVEQSSVHDGPVGNAETPESSRQ